jgi:hypothetical protein
MDQILLAIQLALGLATSSRCSLSPTLFRHPDLVVVLGRAEGVSDSTSQGTVERLKFFRLEGGNPGSIANVLGAAPDSTIWVRPWSYDAACRRTSWPGGRLWVPQDSTGVVQLHLEPKEMWHHGRPTFDAYNAPYEPFPLAHQGYDTRPSHSALAATDYFDFLMALPDYAPGETSSMPLSLERWLNAHPDLRERYPVAETLWYWTRRR